MNKITWLHISDFHFKKSDSYDRDLVLDTLVKFISKKVESGLRPDIIFATGDIANTGASEEYESATKFFDAILAATHLGKADLIVVPGNHDTDRQQSARLLRTLKSEEESTSFFNSTTGLPHIESKMGEFQKWYDEYFVGHRRYPTNTTCGPIILKTIKGINLKILPLNTALFAHDDGDNGKLWVGRRCLDVAITELNSAVKTDSDVNIALMHHPLDWLSRVEHSKIKSRLQESVDLILTGHLHETDVNEVAGLHGSVIQLSAGACYQGSKWPNRAMFGTLENSSITILPIGYFDAPRELWNVDPSVFPDEPNFAKAFQMPRSVRSITSSSQHLPIASDIILPATSLTVAEIPHQSDRYESIKRDFFGELLSSTFGEPLFVEPRIMQSPPTVEAAVHSVGPAISIREIVDSQKSYVIEARSEYGGSTLCKRLALEFAKDQKFEAIVRDAKSLPNYKKKLESELIPQQKSTSEFKVLILDNVDIEKHERLISELGTISYFDATIIVAVNRGFSSGTAMKLSETFKGFEILYLWGLSRSEIRHLAKSAFGTEDDNRVSDVVDKVYGDLLALCIPLTPSNVIMYLNVLHREGDYCPLNKVDIIARYLQEILRKPSDSYADSFNAKNKIDFTSNFVYHLYSNGITDFDENVWNLYVKNYQEKHFSEFNSRELLDELISSKIFVKVGSIIYLKYSFFYNFFAGYTIAKNPEYMKKFIDSKDYNTCDGIVEAITGLRSDVEELVLAITDELEEHVKNFQTTYIKETFDPYSNATWSHSEDDDEKLWLTVNKQIEEGPLDSANVDIIKTSTLAEAVTADQRVRYERYKELEKVIFYTGSVLRIAIKNSHDVDGSLKMRAIKTIFNYELIAFQLGTLLAPKLAESRLVQWGGMAFFNFNQKNLQPDGDNSPIYAKVVVNVCVAICQTVADVIGSKKLAPVFKRIEKNPDTNRFQDLLAFHCIITSKGNLWFECAEKYIENTRRTSYYLYLMLILLHQNLKQDVNTIKEREFIKRLISIIRAKRGKRKEKLPNSVIDKYLMHFDDERPTRNDGDQPAE